MHPVDALSFKFEPNHRLATRALLLPKPPETDKPLYGEVDGDEFTVMATPGAMRSSYDPVGRGVISDDGTVQVACELSRQTKRLLTRMTWFFVLFSCVFTLVAVSMATQGASYILLILLFLPAFPFMNRAMARGFFNVGCKRFEEKLRGSL